MRVCKFFRNYLIPFAFVICLFATPSLSQACDKIDGLEDINCDGKLTIVTFGDSITYGRRDNLYYKDPKKRGYPGRMRPYFKHADIRNLGVPAEDTPTGVKRAQKVFKGLKVADYVIILEGVNDYYLNVPATKTKANLLTMEHAAAVNGSVTLIGFLTPVNRPQQKPWVAAVNKALKTTASVNFNKLDYRLINTHDNLHPGEEGYLVMAKIAADALKKVSSEMTPPAL